MIAELMPYPAMKDSGIELLSEVPEYWGGTAGRLTEYRHPVNNYRLFKLVEVEKLRGQIEKPFVTKSKKPRPR